MIVRLFDEDTDLAKICLWLKQRNMNPALAKDLPRCGLVVEDTHGDAIAAGFIRLVEGGHGMTDGYITNPRSSPRDRDIALDLLTKALIEEAQSLEIHKLFAFSVDKNTIERSQKHGYNTSNAYTILVKDLK